MLKGLRRRLAAWDDAREVFANSGWVVLDNAARIVLALAVSVALARCLGAERLGMLKYAMAVVALCGVFAKLGVHGIVVRELVTSPGVAGETLGTVSILYLIGSVVSFLVCVGVAVLFVDGSSVTVALILILSVGVLFSVPRIYVAWFDAKVRSKYAIYARGVASGLSAIGAIVAAFLGADVHIFAIIVVSDTILTAVALTSLGAWHRDIPRRLTFSAPRMKSLLAQSWPLIASRVAAMLYFKIDQVMIGEMMGPADVGVYAVAAEISEMWYFIPAALATSAFAGMIKLLKSDHAAYRRRRQDLLDMMVLISGAIVACIVVIADPAVSYLYGDAYTAAAGVLRIHICAAPFIFMGYVLGKTIVAEGYLRFALWRQVFGAVVNIVLNLLLIPRFGLYGAAWATVISYACGAYVACIFQRDARRMFEPMTRALLLPVRALMKRTG